MKASADGCGCFPTGRHYAGIAHLLRLKVVGAAEELSIDAQWIDLPIVLIDTETTGRDPAVDRIVEIGLILGRGGEIVERRNWLVNPEMPIPEEVSKIHGITDAEVADKPTFREIAGEIVEFLRGALPGAYNATFDRNFVFEEMRRAKIELGASAPPALRHGVEWVDPLVWARQIQRDEKSKALGEVCARLGIPLENAHRASDDAEAALRVLYILGQDQQVPRTYGGLVQEQRRLARAQEEEFKLWRANRPS